MKSETAICEYRAYGYGVPSFPSKHSIIFGVLPNERARLGFASRQHVVKNRHAVSSRFALRAFHERSGDHCNQVCAVRHLLTIPKERLAVFLFAFEELAVPERKHSFRYDDGRFGTLLFMRIIEAGEPIARVLILALGPQMRDLLGVGGRGLDKKQSVTRALHAISDREGRLFAGINCRIEVDLERTISLLKVERTRARSNLVDCFYLQINRIEHQTRNGLVERADRQRTDAVDGLRIKIWRQMKRDCLDRNELIRAVLRTRARQRKPLTLVCIVEHYRERLTSRMQVSPVPFASLRSLRAPRRL